MATTVLGSGTVVPEADRQCASYFVETDGATLLLDCGPGALHRMVRFGLPWSRIGCIALSHFHTDHIGGLPILFFALQHGLAAPRERPLDVLGPAGTASLFSRLAQAFGDHMTEPGFPVRIRELTADDGSGLDGGATIRARPTPHTDASLAYRVEGGARTLGYTGDTGFDEDVGRFLRGVDTLIAECSLPDDAELETHLTPSRVAAIARLARPDELVLTHIYPQLGVERAPLRVREAGWEGPLRVATDGLRLEAP